MLRVPQNFARFRIMKRLIILINAAYVAWAAEKEWINYGATNLQNWNNEISVDGLFFAVDVRNPMAFYSPAENVCRLVIPMGIVDNRSDSLWSWSASARQVECPTQEKYSTFWIDPRNWRSSFTSPATPHLERLPCMDDSVSFSQTQDLFVILPSQPVIFRRIYWKKRLLVQYNFKRIVKTEEFLKDFVVTGAKEVAEILQLSPNDCNNRTGCECGTAKFYKGTCKLLRDECDRPANCVKPVKPDLHCCKICGSYLRILVNGNTFVKKKLSETLVKFFARERGFHHHLSTLSESFVQVVIVPKDEGITHRDVGNVAKKLSALLLSSDLTLGINEVNVFSSSDPDRSVVWTSFVLLIAAVFAVVILVIIVSFVCQSKLYINKLASLFTTSFSFAKVENEPENNEIEGRDREHVDQPPKNVDCENNVEEATAKNEIASTSSAESVLLDISSNGDPPTE